MRILGLDPGLRATGWGVISVNGPRLSFVAAGVIKAQGDDLATRLCDLHRNLTQLVQDQCPDAAAVEETFVNSNGASTLKLGQARAMALLVPAQAGLRVGEYAPNTVKKTVVGVGHAAKEQVAHMVGLQLPGVGRLGADATDALAIAICHAHHMGTQNALDAAIRASA